jgi:hypothetical protein
MDLLRLGKLLFLMIPYVLRGDTTSIKTYSLGLSISKPISGIGKKNISMEIFGSVKMKLVSFQTSFGYEKLHLDKGLKNSSINTSYISGNQYNQIDGYFFRIGAQKCFKAKMPKLKNQVKFYLSCNFLISYYRQELKIKYNGAYIDNVFSYRNYVSSTYSIEPEIGFILFQSKNKKFRFENKSRIGLFLKEPLYPKFIDKLPGVTNVNSKLMHTGVVNFCLFFNL